MGVYLSRNVLHLGTVFSGFWRSCMCASLRLWAFLVLLRVKRNAYLLLRELSIVLKNVIVTVTKKWKNSKGNIAYLLVSEIVLAEVPHYSQKVVGLALVVLPSLHAALVGRFSGVSRHLF